MLPLAFRTSKQKCKTLVLVCLLLIAVNLGLLLAGNPIATPVSSQTYQNLNSMQNDTRQLFKQAMNYLHVAHHNISQQAKTGNANKEQQVWSRTKSSNSSTNKQQPVIQIGKERDASSDPQLKQKQTQERVRLGQPKPQSRQITVYVVQVQRGTHRCALINSISIVTPVTIQSTKETVRTYGVGYLLFLADSQDMFAQEAIFGGFPDYPIRDIQLHLDADYAGINAVLGMCQCHTVLYMGHHLKILPLPPTHTLLKATSNFQVVYSRRAMREGIAIDLADLETIDLRTLEPHLLNQYLLVFDARLLRFVTPFSQAYYGRFTVQEMFVKPALALAQKLGRVSGFNHLVHEFNESVIQYKHFALLQPSSPSLNSPQFCFVSYPQTVGVLDPEQATVYLFSLLSIRSHSRTSIVVYLPYSPNPQPEQYSSILWAGELLSRRDGVDRFRIRFLGAGTLSTFAVYESAFVFCPTQSVLIAGGHGVSFYDFFLDHIASQIPNNSYIICAYTAIRKGNVEIVTVNENQIGQLLGSPSSYFKYLRPLQILRAELMRRCSLWALTADQLRLETSAAAYIVPILLTETPEIISTPVFRHQSTPPTKEQQQQLGKIRSKSKKIASKPIPFNSLHNQALQLQWQPRMPKHIHILASYPQSQQQSLRTVCPHFQISRWSLSRITEQQFPLTYSLYTRLHQHGSSTGRSAYNDLAELVIMTEALYNHGGIYVADGCRVLRPLQPFLKYPFLVDSVSPEWDWLGQRVVGALQHSYHLKILISEVLRVGAIDLIDQAVQYGKMLRSVFNEQEVYMKVRVAVNQFIQGPRCQTQECRHDPDAYVYCSS